MAFYRGMDGSVRVGTDTVAQIESWSASVALEELDTTVMGNAWRGVLGGIASWQGQASARLDAAAVGQDDLLGALLVSTPAGTTVTLELRASATKYFSGPALLRNLQFGAQLGQIINVSFDFTGAGPLTMAWT